MGAAAAIFAVWLLIGVSGGVGTVWLVRRVWKQRSRPGLALKMGASLVMTSALLVVFGVVFGVLTALGAVGGESVDPSNKARLLAEGLSEAMNSTAFGLVVWIPSMIVTVVLLRKDQAIRSQDEP